MKFHLIVISFAASKAMYMIGVSYSKNNFHANQHLPSQFMCQGGRIEMLVTFTSEVTGTKRRNVDL